MKNAATKAVQKTSKRYYDRRKKHGHPLKGALLKVVQIPSPQEAIDMTRSAITNEASCSSEVSNTASKNHPADSLTKEQLIAAVEAAGLTGMSGNGFPVARKLSALTSSTSLQSVLLVNAAECDPGLVHDEWLVNTHLADIRRGMDIISRTFQISRSVLAVKAVKRTQTTGMSSAREHDMEICSVPARYPAGEEHFLIQTALGIDLPKSALPVDHGILVMNVQTIWQIARILDGSYDGGRYITVADIKHGIARPAYVNTDTRVAELLHKAFGIKPPTEYKCHAGGGIMASHEMTADETCGETISFAAYLPTDLAAVLSNQNRCKGCGACSRKCPAGIDVRKIVSLREQNADADISLYHPEACLHCGSCTWFCHGNKIPERYMKS